MLFSFAFALYFLVLYVYGIKFSIKKNKIKNTSRRHLLDLDDDIY